MISKSVHIVRENTVFFLGVIVIFAVLSLVQQAGYFKSSQGVVTTVIWLGVTWLVQRAALFDLKMHQKHPDPNVDKTFARFLAKGFLLTVFGIVLSVPFIIVGLGATTGQGGPSGGGYLILVGGALLCITVVLSLLGTWLPAGIYGQEKGFGTALTRGLRTFFPVFFRLVAVNIVAFVILIALMAAFSTQVEATALTGPNAISLLFDALTSITGIITTTYSAVVLAETYRAYEANRATSASES